MILTLSSVKGGVSLAGLLETVETGFIRSIDEFNIQLTDKYLNGRKIIM